jgi:hypothetical protein
MLVEKFEEKSCKQAKSWQGSSSLANEKLVHASKNRCERVSPLVRISKSVFAQSFHTGARISFENRSIF